MDTTDEATNKGPGSSGNDLAGTYAEVKDEIAKLMRNLEDLKVEVDEHGAIAIALAARDPYTVKTSSHEALQITVALQHIAVAVLNVQNLLISSETSINLAQMIHKELGRAPFQTYNQARAELMEVIQRPFKPIQEEWANMPMLEGFKVRRKQNP